MSLLEPADPNWPDEAQTEIQRWQDASLPGLLTIHHIGSTSVPDLLAKPVIDLLPVFSDMANLDAARLTIETMGYEWLGEFGLPGRRYVRMDDPQTGKRILQAHCYVDGSAEITRHLAFRDALRADPALRDTYATVKSRCAAAHPDNYHAYGDCKSTWIQQTEAQALETYK
ncbi:GrpB family protein [Ruegeria sp. Ofav3-42]|uniref:GrpB family protein n=1 Tax=Ruegeria sp. Ofav3-42 TaxID=2917759 RepID=UPI001EF74424|nr:GrpB family protein [Ruegeria sp. Ofav3-42]MCG7518044.1 GrpB family protein [Ruegeria sp. Ofav3-42]